MPILAVLKPKEGGRDSNIAFDVGPANAAHAPSVKSVGIAGQMAGSRANVIIADDVEIPKNSMTQVQCDKLAEAVKEFDAILNPGGRIIYLGTPHVRCRFTMCSSPVAISAASGRCAIPRRSRPRYTVTTWPTGSRRRSPKIRA